MSSSAIPEEIEHLSDLLLSADEATVLLGLQILINNYAYILPLKRVITLITHRWWNHPEITRNISTIRTIYKAPWVKLLKEIDFWQSMYFKQFLRTNRPRRDVSQAKIFEQAYRLYEPYFLKNAKGITEYIFIATQLTQTIKNDWHCTENMLKAVLSVQPRNELAWKGLLLLYAKHKL